MSATICFHTGNPPSRMGWASLPPTWTPGRLKDMKEQKNSDNIFHNKSQNLPDLSATTSRPSTCVTMASRSATNYQANTSNILMRSTSARQSLSARTLKQFLHDGKEISDSDRETLERAELRMNSAVRCVAAAVNSRMGVRTGTGTGTGPRDGDRTYSLTLTDSENRLNTFRCKGDYCRVRTIISGRAGDDNSDGSRSSSAGRCDVSSDLAVTGRAYFTPSEFALLQSHQIPISTDRTSSSSVPYAPHDYDMISMRSIRMAREERRNHEGKMKKEKLTEKDREGGEEISYQSNVSLNKSRPSRQKSFPKESRMFVKDEVSQLKYRRIKSNRITPLILKFAKQALHLLEAIVF